jgi:hypothetical protein
MKHGFDYRMRAIEAQGDFGPMPDLSELTPYSGELPGQLRGSMIVVGWLDENQPQAAAAYGNMLDSLYVQFKDSPYLYFTTIAKASPDYLGRWTNEHDLPLDDMLSILETDADGFRNTAKEFNLPVEPGLEPMVALVDSSMTIKKYYNLADREQTIGLVQLISLIIPLPEKADVVMDPKREY